MYSAVLEKLWKLCIQALRPLLQRDHFLGDWGPAGGAGGLAQEALGPREGV